MPATVTLATTTLTYGVDEFVGEVVVASSTNILPGMRLWIDRELLKVKSVSPVPRQQGVAIAVFRGVDGTKASIHSSSALVTIGAPDQFYTADPVGSPPIVIPVSPYINAFNGRVWLSQGDAIEPSYRWWQDVTQTYGIGPLGIRTQTAAPTAST